MRRAHRYKPLLPLRTNPAASSVLQIRADPAHQIMRSRTHRNQITREIQRIPRKKCADARETAGADPRSLRGACPDIRVLASSGDSPIPSRVIARATTSRGASSSRRMVPLHESLAAIVAQIGPLAAQAPPRSEIEAHRETKMRSDETGKTPCPPVLRRPRAASAMPSPVATAGLVVSL